MLIYFAHPFFLLSFPFFYHSFQSVFSLLIISVPWIDPHFPCTCFPEVLRNPSCIILLLLTWIFDDTLPRPWYVMTIMMIHGVALSVIWPVIFIADLCLTFMHLSFLVISWTRAHACIPLLATLWTATIVSFPWKRSLHDYNFISLHVSITT